MDVWNFVHARTHMKPPIIRWRFQDFFQPKKITVRSSLVMQAKWTPWKFPLPTQDPPHQFPLFPLHHCLQSFSRQNTAWASSLTEQQNKIEGEWDERGRSVLAALGGWVRAAWANYSTMYSILKVALGTRVPFKYITPHFKLASPSKQGGYFRQVLSFPPALHREQLRYLPSHSGCQVEVFGADCDDYAFGWSYN